MMLNNHLVEIKIHNSNKKHFEKILNRRLKTGEMIIIEQDKLPPTSRTEVFCECDLCGSQFSRVRKDVKRNTFCGSECRNEFLKTQNPNLNKPKFKVNCVICNEEFEVVESKYKNQQNFLCSRDCYKIHRSINYNGDKLYNYQPNHIQCDNDGCENLVKVSEWYLNNKKHHFCSQLCYWEFRSHHYKEFYYVPQLFEERKETLPEQLVRNELDKHNIKYIQEFNIDKYYVDFYIPENNIIIEVYGDYWHANPKIYGNDKGKRKLHKNQIGKWEQDKEREDYLKSKGYKVYVIWECDVYENVGLHLNDVLLLCV